jgi:hypothetical protein
MKFFKKKKYSGNSVIRKYEIKNTSRIFLEGWSNKFWFYTQGYKWIKHLTKYINPFFFNNHEFKNFLMLVDDESLMFKDLGVFFNIYVHKSISSLLINGWTFNVFYLGSSWKAERYSITCRWLGVYNFLKLLHSIA